jgi:prepilin-type N-terminal cleavage/methylation domain-containing protein
MKLTLNHRVRAFTLIELLVVVSVIALLMGLLLPALGKARENSRRVKCLVNLHSIGQGLQMYLDQEAKGWILPKVRPLNQGSNNNDPSLLDVMAKYVDAALPQETAPGSGEWIVSDPWKCPSDQLTWRNTGTSWEYGPAAVMTFAEAFLVPMHPERLDLPQIAVSKAYEIHAKKLPILYDADDWHNPRFDVNNREADPNDPNGGVFRWDKNALFYGDLHADRAPPPDLQDGLVLMNEVLHAAGGS